MKIIETKSIRRKREREYKKIGKKIAKGTVTKVVEFKNETILMK